MERQAAGVERQAASGNWHSSFDSLGSAPAVAHVAHPVAHLPRSALQISPYFSMDSGWCSACNAQILTHYVGEEIFEREYENKIFST